MVPLAFDRFFSVTTMLSLCLPRFISEGAPVKSPVGRVRVVLSGGRRYAWGGISAAYSQGWQKWKPVGITKRTSSLGFMLETGSMICGCGGKGLNELASMLWERASSSNGVRDLVFICFDLTEQWSMQRPARSRSLWRFRWRYFDRSRRIPWETFWEC